MDSNSRNDFLTLGQAETETGLPIKRIRVAVKTGQIPEYRFGAWRRVRRQDLEAWIDAHRVPHAVVLDSLDPTTDDAGEKL